MRFIPHEHKFEVYLSGLRCEECGLTVRTKEQAENHIQFSVIERAVALVFWAFGLAWTVVGLIWLYAWSFA